MKTRLLDQKENLHTIYFKCLLNKNVITAKVSDHHPIIHDGVLFWNVMMQGKLRNHSARLSYNNGFGIVETDAHYIARLKKIADVIAEIIYLHPSIEVISLCEGPIQFPHINIFEHALKKHSSMNKFFVNSLFKNIFHKPDIKGFPNWGLLMIVDKKYTVNEVEYDFKDQQILFDKLANRFQLWKLTNHHGEKKYFGLAHFPFSGDERMTEQQKLSIYGSLYCNLVKNVIDYYSQEQFIFCADFNLNPYLISEWKDRAMDSIANNNSILLTIEEKINIVDTVTVDGILLSRLEKQRLYSHSNFGLFNKLEKENRFAQAKMKEYLIQNRHRDANLQNIYDQKFGLVLRD